ncbi:hypothetical protein O181_041675 [Austropuccinia psidii MF-1]|uniref:Uncharacterized protein n=1 Tax=Austropuccinia psidii MF-1 TaxID=1389203 RepID=A0A9Q3DFA9_9BASI|nr:hypothetical protein [Austropuccinia psidii MF-1]
MFLDCFKGQFFAAAICFTLLSFVYTASNQQCTLYYGPSNLNANLFINCRNNQGTLYSCPKLSCHTGNETTVITRRTRFDDNFYFRKCIGFDTKKPTAFIWPDRFVDQSTKYSNKLTVLSGRISDKRDGKKVNTTEFFNCYSGPRSHHNNRRPWCCACDPLP